MDRDSSVVLTRRNALLLGLGVGACAFASSVGVALAGLGAGGSIGGGGGEGLYNGYPYIDWYDSLNGEEQGHTLDSNYTFWNNHVIADFRAHGVLPPTNSYGYTIQLDGPSYIRNNGEHFSFPKAKNAMLAAMKSALARNGVAVPTNTADLNAAFAKYHVRIVGIATSFGSVDGETYTTNVPLHVNNLPLEKLFEELGMKRLPAIDGPDKGVGVLHAAHGWSVDQATKMRDMYLADFRAGNVNDSITGYSLYDFFTWAVSDADLSLCFSVHKVSGRPEIESDVRGAEYTVYTDDTFTTIAKTVDGKDAIGVVGADGYTQTMLLGRTKFSDAGATVAETAVYYVKETKVPSNGKFAIDPNEYTIYGDGRIVSNTGHESRGFVLTPNPEPMVGFFTVEKSPKF